MTPLKNKNLPIVWISGQQNTGKRTHGNLIKERFDYEHINTTELLRQEAAKETERGVMIKDAMNFKKKIPDDIIIDLLKESLLTATTDKGFVISNFPKNAKQAVMFVKEIGNVSFILHLYSDTGCLINRAKERSEDNLNEDILKRDIIFASRDIRLSLMKFTDKVENINTHDPPDSVFGTIERAFTERLQLAPPIAAETDYVQQQNNIQEEI
ncbi:adenylate kinase isoenzyme 5-like [Anoplophora glabripennis]|uniref:adenylate kinase isoenzyme 5-like n=1 Tax=Anoplophora glabripennis TaxID=217634 RepID=UPI000874501E|nr:adenylate kinase isoenzyme 5-like [Anoplophora glabripennis]